MWFLRGTLGNTAGFVQHIRKGPIYNMDNKRATRENSLSARRETRRMQKKVREIVVIAMAGIIVAGIVLVLCGSGIEKRHAEQKTAEAKAKVSQDEKKESKEDTEAKKIEEVLSSDPYGAQLSELYKKRPAAKTIILNRAAYSDELLTYLFDHEEALQWVIDYPAQSARASEEIDAEALQAVDLKDYRIQNHIPLYFQWSEVWGYASYGAENVAMGGCGPTCLSMVATGLTGNTAITPKYVADLSVSSGYYTEEYGTDWNLMTAGAAQLGLVSTQLTSWTVDSLRAELTAGHPVICSMGPGDFTKQGHFIVLSGVTEDGKLLINDPNSKVNSRKKWDVEKVMSQMKAAWSFRVG